MSMFPRDSILANITNNYISISIYFSYLLFRLLQVMVDFFLCSSFDIDFFFFKSTGGGSLVGWGRVWVVFPKIVYYQSF